MYVYKYKSVDCMGNAYQMLCKLMRVSDILAVVTFSFDIDMTLMRDIDVLSRSYNGYKL